MSKAIYFAGVSRVNGVLKFRTAANPGRLQQLGKLGDTNIEMINVNVNSKSEAAKELLARNFANGRADIDALLVKVATDDNPFKAKTVKVRAKKAEVVDGVVKVGRGALGKVYPEIKMTPKQAEQIRNEFNAKHKNVA